MPTGIYIRTKEHNQKIREGLNNPIVKEKISKIRKGKPSNGVLEKYIKAHGPWNKGLKNWMPEESKQRMIAAKIGKPAWNKGIPLSKEHKYKLSESLHGRKVWNKGVKNTWYNPAGLEKGRGFYKNKPFLQIRDEKHWGWKGDDVGYIALHSWVKRRLGKPSKCEHCGKDGLTGRQIHWANKSQEYKRDLTDWLRLCVSCHIKYDKEFSSKQIILR